MNDRQVTEKEIMNTKRAIHESKLLRLAAFSNQIDRFLLIKLKKKINRMNVIALVTLAAEGGTLTPGNLGKRILRTNDYVSKLTDVLVKDGMVTRKHKGKDRRNVQIKITPSGLDLVNEILADIKKDEILIKSCLEAEDFEQFEKLLVEFRRNLIQKI